MGDAGPDRAAWVAPSTFATLLLADGRFPSGSHAHSHGLEAAVNAGLVRDLPDLQAWMTGTLHTTWLLDAAVAVLAAGLITTPDQGEGIGTTTDVSAAAEGQAPGAAKAETTASVTAAGVAALTELDRELEVRTTAPLQRQASRTLGRQLLRAGRAAWPDPWLDALRLTHPDGPAVPIAYGVTAAVAGLGPDDIASTWLHLAVQGATSAAVRLLGLDPYAVIGVTAAARDALQDVAAHAVAAGRGTPADLPAAGAPMLDILLAAHAEADMRLFST